MNYPRVPGGQVGQLVRAPKTSELIAAQLRRQIVRRAVKAGEKLPPETRLMEQFGVSRPTIREAFRILETGSSADRQLATFQRTGDLKAVADQLVRETREGVTEGRPGEEP